MSEASLSFRPYETQFTTYSSEETFSLGKKLGAALPNNALICLFGSLAAGKTTLIKGFAETSVGYDSALVHSPTFSYLHIYKGKDKSLYHFDLYRLSEVASQAAEDFLSMGFDEFFLGNLCCVEWPERISSLLPESAIFISLEHGIDNCRHISLSAPFPLVL